MRWEGRTLEESQKQWVKVFRPLRNEDEVRLIERLAAGWEVVGEGNNSIELWDDAFEVGALIEDLIEEINSEKDEGVDWSFLASLDGMQKDYELSQWEMRNVDELLSHIDGVNIHRHEWTGGARFGAYKHLLVKKVKRYRVMEVLKAVASELGQQQGMPSTTG
jgi:hypothetical protein